MPTSTLRLCRETRNYSQEYVASILDISQPTYARLEYDPSKLTAEHAQKLADLYQVNISDLLSEAEAIITFKSIRDNTNNINNGYVKNNTNHYDAAEVSALKEHIASLEKQIAELLKMLAAKLNG